MMRLKVIALQGLYLEETVEFLKFIGPLGETGILPHHAPLLTRVLPGKISYKIHGKEHHFYTLGGLVEVYHNKITLLADRCSDAPLLLKKAQDLTTLEQDRLAQKKSFHHLYGELARNSLDIRLFEGAGRKL